MPQLVLYGPDTKHGAKKRKGFKRYVWYIVWHESRKKRERSTGFGLGERDRAETSFGQWLAARSPRSQGPRDPHEVLIADVLALYLEEHAPHTADPKRIGQCIVALLDYFGELVVARINTTLCRSYVAHRQKHGRATGTASRELRCLSAALHHCVKSGLLTHAPSVWLPSRPAPRQRWLTRDECAALLRAAKSEPKARGHLPMFILLALYTGHRRNAILGLQWQPNTTGDGWVDLENKTIHWGWSGTKKQRGEPTPIPRPLLTFLRLARHRTSRSVLELPHGHVCSVKRSWGTALNRSDIPHARIHDLRHTAATIQLSKGVPPWKVAKYIGVSLDTLLTVYGHVIPGALDEAKEAMERR